MQYAIEPFVGSASSPFTFLFGALLLPGALGRQGRLNSPEFKARFGFLFKGFKPKLYFWELVVLLRKIAIMFVLVYLKVCAIGGARL